MANHYQQVLSYWRDIEIFNMPDLPRNERNPGKVHTKLFSQERLPWQTSAMQKNSPNKKWVHTLYFHCIKKQAVIDQLNKLLPPVDDDYREPIGGTTCLAFLLLDQAGQPMEKTYIRASFAYGLTLLQQRRKLSEIPELQEKARQEFLDRFQIQVEVDEPVEDESNEDDDEWNEDYDFDEEDEETHNGDEEEDAMNEYPLHTGVTWLELDKELADLQQLLPGKINPVMEILCVSQEVRNPETMDPTFLNSFYFNDLTHLIDNAHDLGPVLKTYLSPANKIKDRFNAQHWQNMMIDINPCFQSPARWPSNPEYGLYSAQQVAVSLTLQQLKEKSGLLGINGPPGTGKTTLLREVIADIILTRARRILKTGIKKLFDFKYNSLEQYIGYYDIDADCFGNDGILVASNNNGAVENISKELPALKSIDHRTFSQASYFSPFASKVIEDSWGLLSAALGNTDNRNKFFNGFWFKNDSQQGFREYLQANEKHQDHYLECYDQTARELRMLLKEYDAFQNDAIRYHELIQSLSTAKRPSATKRRQAESLAGSLIKKYGFTIEALIQSDFGETPLHGIHAQTPYSSSMINKLRSDIFIKSLELHQYAILYNAKKFRSNLEAYRNMISGKNRSLYNEKTGRILWNSFFFCIPVVSTTLASIERLLYNMEERSIGWLLLDEAGQATPQSACGAIWRSQRCIIIGDTLQIPPVVTIPQELAVLLQTEAGLIDTCWLPHNSSAQSLADRVTPYGTTISINAEDIWTGIPLRAHRRCDEPMFSIANKIAYNYQMVKVTPDSKFNINLGKSQWIDVPGKIMLDKNTVKEEIDRLTLVVDKLYQSSYNENIFIISPFRLIADQCADIFKWDERIHCGTVHKFQGKEADIVFLVLGSAPSNARAREWASAQPNLLNVAVTRAKKRLYVIGNKKLWGDLNYFNVLNDALG
jgi:hypothetical protein